MSAASAPCFGFPTTLSGVYISFPPSGTSCIYDYRAGIVLRKYENGASSPDMPAFTFPDLKAQSVSKNLA